MPPKKRFSPKKGPIIRRRLMCEPAMLYLLVAMMGLLVLGLQNLTQRWFILHG